MCVLVWIDNVGENWKHNFNKSYFWKKFFWLLIYCLINIFSFLSPVLLVVVAQTHMKCRCRKKFNWFFVWLTIDFSLLFTTTTTKSEQINHIVATWLLGPVVRYELWQSKWKGKKKQYPIVLRIFSVSGHTHYIPYYALCCLCLSCVCFYRRGKLKKINNSSGWR